MSAQNGIMASHLYTHQKDEVYRLIEIQGLNPSDFKWKKEVDLHLIRSGSEESETIKQTVGRRLIHTPTKYYFAFIDAHERADFSEKVKEPHSVQFFPSETKSPEQFDEITWREVVQTVEFWLNRVRREYDAPNLWKQLRSGQLPSLKSSVDESSSFTPDEIERIGTSVDQVVEEIRANQNSLGLLSEQANYLIGEIDDLKRLAKHTTKRQLRQTLVGILFAFSLQIGYDLDRTKQLLELVGKAFDWLVELSYYLPKG